MENLSPSKQNIAHLEAYASARSVALNVALLARIVWLGEQSVKIAIKQMKLRRSGIKLNTYYNMYPEIFNLYEKYMKCVVYTIYIYLR
jgi:hypothetical protein